MGDDLEEKNVRQILEEAAKAVDGFDPDLKVKAFELAFAHLTTATNKPEHISLQPSVVDSGQNDFFSKLGQETSIQVDHLKSVYRQDKKNQVKIVVPISGNSAEKQRKLAYLYFFAMRIGFGAEWISSTEFAKQTNEYGVNDSHASKNLKQDKEHIRQAGRRRGKEYSLTPNGMLRAKELLSELAK